MRLKHTLLGSIAWCLVAPVESQTARGHLARLSLLATGVLLAAGCAASSDSPADAALEESFQLRVGQSAVVSDADLTIGFQGVSADSRCGKGEVCVWEGDAVVRIWLRQVGGSRQERELHTASRGGPGSLAYAGFRIRLVALDPPAIAGRTISRTDYVATVLVTHGGAGGDEIQ